MSNDAVEHCLKYFLRNLRNGGSRYLPGGVIGIAFDFHFYDGKTPSLEITCGFQPGDHFMMKLCVVGAGCVSKDWIVR